MCVLNNRSGLHFGRKKKKQWFAAKSALDMRKPSRKSHARSIFSLPSKSSGHVTYHSTIGADIDLHTTRFSTRKLSTCVMTPDVRYRLMDTHCLELRPDENRSGEPCMCYRVSVLLSFCGEKGPPKKDSCVLIDAVPNTYYSRKL